MRCSQGRVLAHGHRVAFAIDGLRAAVSSIIVKRLFERIGRDPHGFARLPACLVVMLVFDAWPVFQTQRRKGARERTAEKVPAENTTRIEG
jgi:hypothetical protein